ncbi:trypsin-like peptidase domain-containing protein [Candidatus Bathyarchaeota archaeon]|nr:trypsin-like peptidase domain-containing protein [Candidatus Bathyarchaeota archaeon]
MLIVVSSVSAYFYLDVNNRYRVLQRENSELQGRIGELQSRLNRLEALTNITGRGSEPDVSSQIYKLIEPSVVKVTVRSWTLLGLTSYGEGSGFVYDSTGHIITNHHVVSGADAIEVTFLDGTTLKAALVGSDPYSDLAVIKVESRKTLIPVVLGDSSKLYVGETVLAVGNPFGLSGSMTKGIVSQLGRTLPTSGNYLIVGVIQVDAAINPGNSGGPLINLRGEVVGVNTAIASMTGEFAGIGFAIPSNLVKKVVPAIINQGYYPHPWLGISGLDVTPSIAEAMNLPNATGFLVTEVLEGSPAAEAGLRGGTNVAVIEGSKVPIGGDVIVGVDQIRVRKLLDLLVYLEYEKNVGDLVKLWIIREGSEREVTVRLGERPPPQTGR